jgi:hypothetical protein
MSSIPLSEQMAAMAFVDELRRQQRHVQDHLDLPRRRAEIQKRIRAYYQSNNIAFDDDLVEQGVHQFFSWRLAFDEPQLTGFDAWLVKNLTNRDLKRSRIKALLPRRRLIKLAALAAVALLIQRCSSFIDYQEKLKNVTLDSIGIDQSYDELYRQVEKVRAELQQLQKSNAEKPDETVSRLLQRAQNALPAGDIRTNINIAGPVTRDNVDALLSELDSLHVKRDAIWGALPAVQENLKLARGVLWIRLGITQMLQDPNRAAAIKQSSNLDQRLAELDQLLERVDNQTTYDDAYSTYSELGRDLSGTDLLQLQTRRYKELKSLLASQSIPSDIRRELDRISSQIEADLERSDADAAEKKINALIETTKSAGYRTRFGQTERNHMTERAVVSTQARS